MKRAAAGWWLSLVLAGLAGCAAPASPPTPHFIILNRLEPTRTPPAAAASASPAPRPTTSPAPPTLAPADLTHPRVSVMAEGLAGPRGLLAMPDGTVLAADAVGGAVWQIGPDSQARVLITGLAQPVGLALLPDGALVIAEQGAHRLTRYDFAARTLAPFITLEGPSGPPEITGLSRDAEALLISDGANGRLWRAAFDGTPAALLAEGLGRPAGIWPEAEGRWLIVDAAGGRLLRRLPDGTLETLASLPGAEAVAADGQGNVYVARPAAGAIQVRPAGSQGFQILVDQLQDPRGLGLDAAGNLWVSEAGRGRVLRISLR